jgi:hypothetical protein
MDSIYLHYAIAHEYNLTRKPALVKFIQNYEGEIKYLCSMDYIIEIQDPFGYRVGIRISS